MQQTTRPKEQLLKYTGVYYFWNNLPGPKFPVSNLKTTCALLNVD